jgi:hypothetical protein
VEQRYAFVLRIWITESSGSAGRQIDTLRGSLQAVDSPEPSRFASLHELNELIYGAIRPPDPPGAPPPATE